LGQLLPEQRYRGIDRTHIVDEEVGPDDNIVETRSIGVKGYFVIGPLVQVIPGDRIQLSLGQFGEVEDVRQSG